MARMPKLLRQLLQNDEANQNDEQVVLREETDQTGLAQGDGALGAERLREDGSERSFWQTMAGTGETSESAQSAARVQSEARIDTGTASQPDAEPDAMPAETQVQAPAMQGEMADDSSQANSASARQGGGTNGAAIDTAADEGPGDQMQPEGDVEQRANFADTATTMAAPELNPADMQPTETASAIDAVPEIQDTEGAPADDRPARDPAAEPILAPGEGARNSFAASGETSTDQGGGSAQASVAPRDLPEAGPGTGQGNGNQGNGNANGLNGTQGNGNANGNANGNNGQGNGNAQEPAAEANGNGNANGQNGTQGNGNANANANGNNGQGNGNAQAAPSQEQAAPAQEPAAPAAETEPVAEEAAGNGQANGNGNGQGNGNSNSNGNGQGNAQATPSQEPVAPAQEPAAPEAEAGPAVEQVAPVEVEEAPEPETEAEAEFLAEEAAGIEPGSTGNQGNGQDNDTGPGQGNGNGNGATQGAGSQEPAAQARETAAPSAPVIEAGPAVEQAAPVETISGGSGSDTLTGGDGIDAISGGEGSDRISGGGDDQLDGGTGNDRMSGGDGADTISGGEGRDYVRGGAGDDRLDGGTGNDQIDGGTGRDRLDGGSGDDILLGGADKDSLKGGDGSDQLDGGSGKDRLDGGKGDDILLGGEGKDSLKGGDGDDVLDGGEGSDKLDGGRGFDTAVFDGNASDYRVTEGRRGIEFEDLREGGSVDTVRNVEAFEFADQTLSVDEVVEAMIAGWSDTFGSSDSAGTQDMGGDTLFGDGGIGNSAMTGITTSRWAANTSLPNAETMSADGGWTADQNSSTEPVVEGGGETFGDNAAGAITTEDSNQMAQQNIDSVDYSGG